MEISHLLVEMHHVDGGTGEARQLRCHPEGVGSTIGEIVWNEDGSHGHDRSVTFDRLKLQSMSGPFQTIVSHRIIGRDLPEPTPGDPAPHAVDQHAASIGAVHWPT
jgi:hypothetical protein